MYGGRDYNPPPPFYSTPSPFNHQIHHSTQVPSKHDAINDFKVPMSWVNSSEAKKHIAAAKAHAISEFKKRFPRADISRFQEEVEFDSKRKATATVLFTESDGSQTDPLIKDRKYWSQALKNALGFHQDGGFPMQLTPFIHTKPKASC